jgi:hypothetical protein
MSDARITETLRDQFGPYGRTVEELKAYVLQRSATHEANGWQLSGVDYRKEMHHPSEQYRYIATATYTRANA